MKIKKHLRLIFNNINKIFISLTQAKPETNKAPKSSTGENKMSDFWAARIVGTCVLCPKLL